MRTKKVLRRLCFWTICCAALVLLQRFCHKQTDGFARNKISSDLSFHPEWEVPSLEPHERQTLFSILSQPYHYLAKGAQSYVFLSEDGKYVIKFFRIYHLQPPLWITHLSWPWFFQPYRLHKILQKYEELHKDFSSYKIAYDSMREETGIVYLHLNKTHALLPSVIFYDKIGVKHCIPLDHMEFLVQKKADLVYPSLARLAEQEGLTQAQTALSHLIELLCLRYERGIRDKDPDLNTNFGFIGQTALQIDVGRFRREKREDPPSAEREEIIRITDNLNQWLKVHYPTLSEYLENRIAQIPSSHEEE